MSRSRSSTAATALCPRPKVLETPASLISGRGFKSTAAGWVGILQRVFLHALTHAIPFGRCEFHLPGELVRVQRGGVLLGLDAQVFDDLVLGTDDKWLLHVAETLLLEIWHHTHGGVDQHAVFHESAVTARPL